MADEKKASEKKINKNLKKTLIILSISLGVLVLFLGPYFLPEDTEIWGITGVKHALSSMELNSVNWRYRAKALASGTVAMGQGTSLVRRKEGYYNNIVIGAIDSESMLKYGRWPFDRKIHADLVNYYNGLSDKRRPDMLFFDIIFGERSKLNSDTALAKSFKDYKGALAEDVILTSIKNFNIKKGTLEDQQLYREKKMQSEGMNYLNPRAQMLKKYEISPSQFSFDPSDVDLMSYNKIDTMMPKLGENLDLIGIANIDSSTSTIHKKPLLVKFTYYTNTVEETKDGKVKREMDFVTKYYPDIVLVMTVKLLGAKLSDLRFKKGMVIIKNATYHGKKTDFKIPVDNRFRMTINYKATQDAQYVRAISYKDLPRTGLRKHSIVMVGVTALGATDVWLSPLGNMPGIYHLAYALGTVLNRDFIRKVPTWIEILYTMLLSFGVALLISRGIRATVAASLVSILVPLVIGFLLFQFNVQIVMMIPLLGAVLSLIGGVIYLLLTEEKEKHFIKSTFSSYVNPDLVDILIQNPEKIKLGGDSKDLTILFSDIRSFTTMSEGMTSEYLIQYLNVYMTLMTDIVMNTGGTLDKYIGDAVMAFWGAPIELKDNALRACEAALQMMEALPKFNAERAQLGDKPINIGIGLNSAVVNVGNVGSEKRKNYTVIGDGVNLASRLEGANKFYKTNIIISEFTYAKVKDKVVARELDLIRVKGKHLPVKIYELVGMR